MKDLIKRLRGQYVMSMYINKQALHADMVEVMKEAADALEAQDKRISVLEEALALADATLSGAHMNVEVVERKVRRALDGDSITTPEENQ